MFSIISNNNKVNFGEINEYPINFNYKDFKLYNFFDKEVKSFLKNFKFHKFNYFGITSGNYFAGIGVVDLGYLFNIFGYLYDFETKKVFEFNKKGILKNNLIYDVNPDNYKIKYKDLINIEKSFDKKTLILNVNFNNKLIINTEFEYDFNKNNPLRLLAPANHNGWVFTEKSALHKPLSFEIIFNKSKLNTDKENTFLTYDWSAGFMKRETNWTWASFSGLNNENQTTGANFASFVNETYCSENIYWENNNKFKAEQIIFEYENNNPNKKWFIYNKNKEIDLIFEPEFERTEKINAIIIKSFFRQFLGKFSGKLNKNTEIKNLYGITEIHRALW